MPTLLDHLAPAVKRWMDELRVQPEGRRRQLARQWTRDARPIVQQRGDVLRYGGHLKQTAEVFNHTARGIAALATAPGGVTLLGMHWCLDHHVCLQAEVEAERRLLNGLAA
jgi:hypothetical protein